MLKLDVVAVGVDEIRGVAARVGSDRDLAGRPPIGRGNRPRRHVLERRRASETWKQRWPVPGSHDAGLRCRPGVRAVVLQQLHEDAVRARDAQVDDARSRSSRCPSAALHVRRPRRASRRSGPPGPACRGRTRGRSMSLTAMPPWKNPVIRDVMPSPARMPVASARSSPTGIVSTESVPWPGVLGGASCGLTLPRVAHTPHTSYLVRYRWTGYWAPHPRSDAAQPGSARGASGERRGRADPRHCQGSLPGISGASEFPDPVSHAQDDWLAIAAVRHLIGPTDRPADHPSDA